MLTLAQPSDEVYKRRGRASRPDQIVRDAASDCRLARGPGAPASSHRHRRVQDEQRRVRVRRPRCRAEDGAGESRTICRNVSRRASKRKRGKRANV